MHHSLLWLPLFGLGLFFFWPWQVALPMFIPMLLLYLVAVWKGGRAQFLPPVTGERAMMGGLAIVVMVDREEVEVEYHGEVWRAQSSHPLERGQQVTIQRVHGLTLLVVPAE